MKSLRRELRRELERAVTAARRVAEKGARAAIEALAVQNGKPWPSMTEGQKQLRNRLRAHGRQLGDSRDQRSGSQSIEHIVQECAYEHWHRMLFARFLAENDLLIEPESGVAISLDECHELATERGVDWFTLASEFAVKMLSQIFRAADPVLELLLPPETRQELEGLMKSLPREVFLADDSLGWVYQFWQAERKKEINASGEKIGADELAPVTQLFTEDYMVLFLLHNTLGAWWAGKILAQQPDLANSAKNEEELRVACAVGDVSWEYLRFVRDDADLWRPAAGTFDGWPREAKNITVLDPCMGSGHFLVFALPMLVALRNAEENIAREDLIEAVLSDNLFGLEIDDRCTQIAAFNLALTAWRIIGHRPLPPLNLACSGLGINAKEEEWAELANNDQRLREGMTELYELFKKGPMLGSLINPRALNKAPLLTAEFHDLQPLLQAALKREEGLNYEAAEMAIAAQGMAKAGEILAGYFTLVATNVPYLGRGKQDEVLKDYCQRVHPKAKADLATCFIERCLECCRQGGSAALVTPQNWLFLSAYESLRERLLRDVTWSAVVRLGSGAFETITGEVVKAGLILVTKAKPPSDSKFSGIDVSSEQGCVRKAKALCLLPPNPMYQEAQLRNPDVRIVLAEIKQGESLGAYADCSQGIMPADRGLFIRFFWEITPDSSGPWKPLQSSAAQTQSYGGLSTAFDLETFEKKYKELGSAYKGTKNWGKNGVCISQMSSLPVSLYLGSVYDGNIDVVVPKEPKHLTALWCFFSSGHFGIEIRKLEQKLDINTGTILKVPFNLGHWLNVAAEKYPHGLPKPFSSDPTQWLFDGKPRGSHQPFHVALARLLDYQWPRQTGSSFPDCPTIGADGLEKLTDTDGIVCLDALQGELSAAERLRALLAAAYGTEWSPAKQSELLTQAGATSLDQWLRERFFEQHCVLFQNRPFIWHIWDGMKTGFHALVNYHKLAASNGEGGRTLEKLIYSYLGDWIKQQRNDQKNGVEGADARVASAEHLKKQLEQILHGEPPYDIFVRWKPLHEQPIGWDPDINDGVRQNIRPFLTATPLTVRTNNACILRVTPKSLQKDKDRGKEPYREKRDFPWFWTWDQSATVDFPGGQKFDGNRWNDLHYSTRFKQAARDRNSQTKSVKR